jgi:hypothetical protein
MISAVLNELKSKGLGEKYSRADVLRYIRKTIKMHIDVKYKEKVLCRPQTRKIAAFLDFIHSANGTLKQLTKMINDNAQDEDVQATLSSFRKHKVDPPPSKTRAPNKERLARPRGRSIPDNSAILPWLDVESKDTGHCRGKSCYCSSCGGLHYYHAVEQKLMLLPPLFRLQTKDSLLFVEPGTLDEARTIDPNDNFHDAHPAANADVVVEIGATRRGEQDPESAQCLKDGHSSVRLTKQR